MTAPTTNSKLCCTFENSRTWIAFKKITGMLSFVTLVQRCPSYFIFSTCHVLPWTLYQTNTRRLGIDWTHNCVVNLCRFPLIVHLTWWSCSEQLKGALVVPISWLLLQNCLLSPLPTSQSMPSRSDRSRLRSETTLVYIWSTLVYCTRFLIVILMKLNLIN